VDQLINPIENSLLLDLLGLYRCDLSRGKHSLRHSRCVACSKQAIIDANCQYRRLDAFHREQAASSPLLTDD
jgi:hypothetical protein